VAGQTEHISDSTKMVHNFHKWLFYFLLIFLS
jgi:hypothetical protein